MSFVHTPRFKSALALACACPLVFPATASAQATILAAAPDPQRVVVTGAREPAPAGNLVGDLVVIDADTIQSSTADSLEDLLRREAGFQLSRNGGPGASAGVMIRGAGVNNTLVLVDGVRVGSATLGQVAFEGLSLGMIERVEVLRGPGSSLYGSDGAGGVVQIFTHRAEGQSRMGAWLAGGQYGAAEAALNASGRAGDLDWAGSLSHEQLDGVSALRPGDQFGNYNPDKDGARRSTAQANLGWQPIQGQRVGLTLMSSHLDSRFDSSEYLPPDYTQDASPDFRNKLDNQLGALEYRAQWSPSWSTLVRASSQEDDLHSGATVVERYRTLRRQLDAQVTWRAGAEQELTLGYVGLKEEATATTYVSDAQRDNQAVVLAWLGSVGALRTQAEIRHDDNSVYGGVTTGRLGGTVPLADGWRLRALAARSFRAPTFNDEYYPGYGVPGIRPEHGRSEELGIDGNLQGVKVGATLWHNQLHDLIGYQVDRSQCPVDPSYDYGCAGNIARARLQGATLTGLGEAGPWIWHAQLDLLDAKDADTGARLNRRAAHQASVAVEYHVGDWRLGAAVLQVGSRPDGVNFQLPEETTLDLKARWAIARGWTLEAKLLNATNVDLQPARDYQGLGRQAWLGVRYSFGEP